MILSFLCLIILILVLFLAFQKNIENFYWMIPTGKISLYDIREEPNLVYIKLNGKYVAIGYWYNNQLYQFR
jgi:hypothetical protein